MEPKKGKPKLRMVGATLNQVEQQDRNYFKLLHKLIDEIYIEAASTFQMTWGRLAVAANLSYLTVSNLGERKTRFPQFKTVFKLARAVGWHLILTDEESAAAGAEGTHQHSKSA